MLEQLRNDPDTIPRPSRDDMMKMLVDSYKELNIDEPHQYKKNFITSAFDGSDDYLVTSELFSLVGDEMKKFRKELESWELPQTLHGLLRYITPPRGVKIPEDDEQPDIPTDEGYVLFDDDPSLDYNPLEYSDVESDDDTGNSSPQPQPSTSW